MAFGFLDDVVDGDDSVVKFKAYAGLDGEKVTGEDFGFHLCTQADKAHFFHPF